MHRPRRLVAAAFLAAATASVVVSPGSAATDGEDRRTPVVSAVEKTRDAVVNISAEEVVVVRTDPFFDRFFQDFFELRPRRRAVTRKNLGSGVIVRPEGYVVTNAHVVARGEKIRVVLADERELEAEVVGTDKDADLAVLKVAADGLPAVVFGRADDAMIGETVIAIGNPFGFSHTVTTGVISATGRSLRTDERTYLDFLQTDASINPGNSGGPLLNVRGEVIGINTAIYGGAQNIGFAIPAERAAQIVDHLIRFGKVKHGYVGLRVQNLTPTLADALDVGRRRGVVVHNVDKGSPAAEAGIRAADVIVAINDHAPRTEHEFEERLALVPEADEFTLTVLRQSEEIEVHIVAAPITDKILDEIGWRRLGVAVSEPAPRGGVMIARVRKNSKSARSGLRSGDILLAIEKHSTDSGADFRRAVADLRRDDKARVAVRRGQGAYRLNLALDE